MKHLRQKQEIFCLKYFEGATATEAMIAAGYSPKYATQNTNHVLSIPVVQERLKELRQKTEDETVMNVLERKQRLSEIARAIIPDFVGDDGIKVTKGTPNVAAVEEITTKTKIYRKGGDPVIITNLKLHNPIPAIQELNKMGGDYSEQPVGNTYNIGAMQVNIGDPKEKLISAISRLAARGPEIQVIAEP